MIYISDYGPIEDCLSNLMMYNPFLHSLKFGVKAVNMSCEVPLYAYVCNYVYKYPRFILNTRTVSVHVPLPYNAQAALVLSRA